MTADSPKLNDSPISLKTTLQFTLLKIPQKASDWIDPKCITPSKTQTDEWTNEQSEKWTDTRNQSWEF